jgi:hypothetical protein
MKQPKLRYIVWVSNGEGYTPTEYPTVEEALIAEKYSADWYLTETVNYISANGYYKQPKQEE